MTDVSLEDKMLGEIIKKLLEEKKNFKNSLLKEANLEIKDYKPGDFIAKEGERPGKIKILLEGTVFVSRFSNRGERIISHTMDGVGFFCLLEAIKGLKENIGSVICLNQTSLLEVPLKVYLDELKKDPLLVQMSLEYLTNFSLDLIDQMNKKTTMTPEENMLTYIYYLAKDKSLPMEIREKKSFYADLFGVNVRSIYRYLNEWESKKYIYRQERKVFVDKKNLAHIRRDFEDLISD
ncbi:cyclic nucleotide-binding domain protein [Clostridiales bacterium KA00134]|nr:cyclic nucleotide-binding domain protein [Clostridiales bacterium KA00134]